MRNRRIVKARWVLAVGLISVALGLVMGAARAPDSGLPPVIQRLSEARSSAESAAAMRALQVHPRMAEPSLAVREQVDSLLTPALLVQEAISDDVVLTYPEE